VDGQTMTSEVEQALLACLGAHPKRLHISEIRTKLRAQGVMASFEAVESALRALASQGRVVADNPGWRAAGRVHSSTAPPPTPVSDALGSSVVPRSSPAATSTSTTVTPSVTASTAPDVSDSEEEENSEPTTLQVVGGRWQCLRRLLAYYQDCLVMEDAPELRGMIDSVHEQWLPVVGHIPWDALHPGRSGFTIRLRSEQGVFQANRARRGEDMALYLGYPVKVVKIKGRTDEAFVVPVFIQAVEADWQPDAIGITPDGLPTINSAWAGYAFKDHQERDGFLRMVGLGDTTTATAPPTLEGLGGRMRTWFGDKVLSPINPVHLDHDEKYDGAETGIYNRAVLMLGPRLKYTKSLLRELREISGWSDEDIERSALRFIFPCDADDTGAPWPWRPHPPGLGPDRVAMTNILFGAQRDAVIQANSRPVTVITGPPGTGKSEVVRAILVNQLLRDRPTLMASRNHGAIDAVVPRLNEMGCGEPVVIRTSTPDLRSRNGWKDQLRTLLSRPQPSQSNQIETHIETVGRHADRLGAAAEHHRVRSELEHAYADAALRLENAEARVLPTALGWRDHVTKWGPRQTGALAEVSTLIGQPDPKPIWLKRVLNWLLRRRHISHQERLEALRSHLPHMDGELGACLTNWQAIAAVVAAAERLRTLENQVAGLQPAESDADLRASIDQMRSHVQALVRMLAGGAGGILLNQATRQRMRNLWAGMQNFSGRRFQAELRREFPTLLKSFPLWCVTNLSVKSGVPLISGVFDLVVVDEASQCDIPSVIPLLARARRAVIVGDPMQLTHITKLGPEQEQLLLGRHRLESFNVQRFSYIVNSSYALAESAPGIDHPVLLDVHLRCHAEIAQFAGTTFYRGGLRVGTDHGALRVPPGARAGIHWTDVVSSIEVAHGSPYAPDEITRCMDILQDLQRVGYTGTIGVVSPFRSNATRINDAAESKFRHEALVKWNFRSSTAHGFQGDERDLMIYSLCCGEGIRPTSAGWLGSPEGMCLMNVAITRARAVLHIVGNRSWAEASGIPHLASLARSCRARSEQITPPGYESVWEERFDQALRAAGIVTVLQHPVAHRRLDLAILSPVKLDIEVDGESFHRSVGGRRKDDDHWRDIQMMALGWTVLRFWVYELREDMPRCVARVRTAIDVGRLSDPVA